MRDIHVYARISWNGQNKNFLTLGVCFIWNLIKNLILVTKVTCQWVCSQNTTSCASHEKCVNVSHQHGLWCLDCLDCGLPSHGFCGLKMNNTNNSRYLFFFCYLCKFMQIVLIRFFIFHMNNNSLLTGN